MEQNLNVYPIDVRENISLPSERLVRRFPSIAPIAALDAALSTTKLAIQSDNPCIQELMDLIEDGENVPPHLFIAHNIIDSIDRLRVTIHSYFDQVHVHMAKVKHDSLPF
jgi:hypothetical protein